MGYHHAHMVDTSIYITVDVASRPDLFVLGGVAKENGQVHITSDIGGMYLREL